MSGAFAFGIPATVTVREVVSAWKDQPLVVIPLALALGLYLLAVNRIRARRGPDWPAGRTGAFLAGVGALVLALTSPVEAFAHSLLSVHMVQHILLMQVAPPLLLLGRPITLTLAASSGTVRRSVARLAHSRAARSVGSPIVGFGSLAIALWASHFTPLYEVSLTNEAVHAAEHVMLLVAALLFWWPIVARDPGAARLSHPGRMLYLFLSMPVMSLLGFVISSSRQVLYIHYVVSSRLLGVSPLADQRLAGTLMWESSMLVSVVALAAVLLDWMHRDEVDALRADVRHDRQARASIGGMHGRST